ncbi:MAG: flagellar export chaperone FliS [Methylococcales bacterium]|nr:flagellar export chaperone FliS [Methylococcales bacterium]
MVRRNANQYAAVHNESVAEEASPHQLIQMLMNGFLMRVNTAKGAVLRNDYQEKSVQISKAMGIVGGLIDGLNLEQGGEIAENLNNLYGYIIQRLFQATVENDVEILDEVSGLMREVQSAWDAIPEMLQ